MSTPRQICSNIHYENEEGIAAMYQCQLYKGHPGAHDSHPDKPNEGMLWKDSAEGVAAPLEPTPPEIAALRQWERDTEKPASASEGNAFMDGFQAGKNHAAAVSKNLQEELAELKEHCISEHDCTFCGLESGKSPR